MIHKDDKNFFIICFFVIGAVSFWTNTIDKNRAKKQENKRINYENEIN